MERNQINAISARKRTDAKAPLFTDDMVREIRSLFNQGLKPHEVAKQLGIANYASLYPLRDGKTYRHVT